MIVRPRPHWLPLLFVWRGSILAQILPQLAVTLALAIVVTVLHGQVLRWKVPMTFVPFSLVGLTLMAAQAFFYNAIFFTYALVLSDFFGIPADRIGWYILPFSVGNLLGPLLLGRLFDTWGRRRMIAFTYATSGILLAISGWMFAEGMFTAQTQTIAWMVIFFFASTAASAAYLTVSETFPLEVRALAIALFYAVGTAIGGIAGPALFGALIDTGSRSSVFAGYCLGAILMLVAAVVGWRYGVAAERRSLESVAAPLAVVE